MVLEALEGLLDLVDGAEVIDDVAEDAELLEAEGKGDELVGLPLDVR